MLIDIDEFRLRTSLRNGFGRSDEGVGHGEYAVPGVDPCGDKCETQRIGSAAYTNTMVDLAELGKCIFKILQPLSLQ